MTKYQSYLLRLWQENPHAMWHASAQCVQTSEVMYFADLESFVTFLWRQTAIMDASERPQLGKEVKA